MSMALIYANAVNKRMSSVPKKKKSLAVACPYHEPSPEADSGRSSSRDSAPSRKCSELVPANVSSLRENHRMVQRSKTSCSELHRKTLSEELAHRKISTPVHALHSSGCQAHSTSLENKRQMAKASLINKYDLETDAILKAKEERRRSISMAVDPWRANEKKESDAGAFQKMKRKFSRWKFAADA